MYTIDPVAEKAQSVAYTGTAGTTANFRARTKAVMVWATTDAYIAVGESVTATTSDTPIPSYTPILFNVPVGTGAPWCVSAIQVSAGGTVYAKPVNGANA